MQASLRGFYPSPPCMPPLPPFFPSLLLLYHHQVDPCFMSKPMWGGNAQPVEKAGRKNHTPVLAPPEKIDMGMMPSFGPIAVAPLDTNIAISGVDYILSDLCEIKNIQLQKGKDEINSDTRGLVWMDSSASQIHLLEEILTEYKQLGWIQLPMAGINSYSSLIERFSDRLWTSAKVCSSTRPPKDFDWLTCSFVRVPMHSQSQNMPSPLHLPSCVIFP